MTNSLGVIETIRKTILDYLWKKRLKFNTESL